jgi:hypothetical protein
MNSVRVQHYPGCTADYPEKPEGEAAQRIMEIDIEDGEKVLQCVDCGAFVAGNIAKPLCACMGTNLRNGKPCPECQKA